MHWKAAELTAAVLTDVALQTCMQTSTYTTHTSARSARLEEQRSDAVGAGLLSHKHSTDVT